VADYTIGVDYGTDSVRALVVDCADGAEVSSSVFAYPRWAAGKYCDPSANRFRQHPLDYVEGLEAAVKGALAAAPAGTAASVRGLSVDTTGSTPCAVDASGRPLSLDPAFAEDPDAMFILWKDHMAVAEAEEINARCRDWGGEDLTRYEGGVYSSEWYWAKILRAVRANPKVGGAAAAWIEHCDWIPALLAGVDRAAAIPRSRCAAGHKALWHRSWGGPPPAEFLAKLDPALVRVGAGMPVETVTADVPVGGLSAEWAARLGLPKGVPVGAGAFDAHMGAVGAGVKPGWLIRIMGTSTCDVMVADSAALGDKQVKGICGQVDGSVLPGFTGLEAGQSAYGDLFAWFRGLLLWSASLSGADPARLKDRILPALEEEARKTPISASNPVFVDWLNGRRTPNADQSLKGAFTGLSLGTDAPRLYRSVVEGASFGAKAIIESFSSQGVAIRGIIGTGGVAKKSSFAMQTMSDVLEMPIRVAASEQCCALGAAIFASAASGVHKSVEAARDAMASPAEREYAPNPANAAAYRELYRRYLAAGAFVEGRSR